MKILQNFKTNRKYLEHAFARGAAVLEVADSVLVVTHCTTRSYRTLITD
jgi:hypothetical protein